MSGPPLGVLSTGLVTSVGLSAAASCAAVRAKLSNPTETRFINSLGDWIVAHSVPLELRCRGRAKLVKMAALAINECLQVVPRGDWNQIPLLLCVAERERPGRHAGIEEELFADIQRDLGENFAETSLIVPHGRVSVSVALVRARKILEVTRAPYALIVATDSLLTWQTLTALEREGRLLRADNSNGFIPGEGAGALLVGPTGAGKLLACTGLGFATEPSTVSSDRPLRADGLSKAIKSAIADAGCSAQDLDFRITDLAGEQYYFKEAALAFSRSVRIQKQEFAIWHPAECIGESGATSGLAAIVIADDATRRGYAPGPNVLCHAAADSGQRAASVFQFGGS